MASCPWHQGIMLTKTELSSIRYSHNALSVKISYANQLYLLLCPGCLLKRSDVNLLSHCCQLLSSMSPAHQTLFHLFNTTPKVKKAHHRNTSQWGEINASNLSEWEFWSRVLTIRSCEVTKLLECISDLQHPLGLGMWHCNTAAKTTGKL